MDEEARVTFDTVLQFYEKYKDIANTEQIWTKVYKEMRFLFDKHDNPLFVKLMVAAYEEIERRAKEKPFDDTGIVALEEEEQLTLF